MKVGAFLNWKDVFALLTTRFTSSALLSHLVEAGLLLLGSAWHKCYQQVSPDTPQVNLKEEPREKKYMLIYIESMA